MLLLRISSADFLLQPGLPNTTMQQLKTALFLFLISSASAKALWLCLIPLIGRKHTKKGPRTFFA
ncbi:hypothetical protein [Phaeodactylibacter xiamenensis]|uniref:hypothetical protein n=1 Tax=Phaeodactylibacter xiamenensis TaxID=1524460 RepID=UPI00126A1326|nr:hypothetical protein [Phaeodactylibacter xiamenensis]